jgi:cycloartenol synthase
MATASLESLLEDKFGINLPLARTMTKLETTKPPLSSTLLRTPTRATSSSATSRPKNGPTPPLCDLSFLSFHLLRKGPFVSTEKPMSAREAAIKGLFFYQTLQCDDGHWAGDYGGPMFLMPGLVCALYVTGAPFPAYKKAAMVTYLKNHQQVDGGWGTHLECASTMFGTVLSYTTLRLLGEPAEEQYLLAARAFILAHGGALYAPSWSKFFLAMIGVYDWAGINSLPPEMWLLPRWSPLHPGKMWCHARMVYLPMSYLYGMRYSPDVSNDPTLLALRRELYPDHMSYDSIPWDSFRQTCASIDAYTPLNPVMKIAQDLLAVYETHLLPRLPFLSRLRARALHWVADYLHAEDIQTNYVDIGPVNKSLNLLSAFVQGGLDPRNENFQRHLLRVDDYLWVAEDGMKVQGYNGSQCWDTSFAVQALLEGGYLDLFPDCTRKIYSYLQRTQIREDEVDRERWFRQVSKGGWPFSTASHGWPISDCTAEGLKGVLAIHRSALGASLLAEERISSERLCDAVDVLLSLHNEDGGWATYENNRGYGWYELLNPSEVFGDIMIDYSYVECTCACITALKAFLASPDPILASHRTDEILHAMVAGREFIKSVQRGDGSWYGSWAVCFTYGTWFGIEGLVAADEPLDSPAIQRALSFLLSKQNPNGGWGESYVACVDKAYPFAGSGDYGEDGSGVVQTSWALLALLAGECEDKAAIDRGVAYLRRKQVRRSLSPPLIAPPHLLCSCLMGTGRKRGSQGSSTAPVASPTPPTATSSLSGPSPATPTPLRSHHLRRRPSPPAARHLGHRQ